MSAASYLEVFIRESVILALRSDPIAKYGLPHTLDGVSLLKKGAILDFEAEAMSCYKGDWNTRLNNYAKIFSHKPQEISTNLSSLENIRKLRNAVGHAFGRDVNRPTDLLARIDGNAEKVDEAKLKRWLKIIDEVATGIDRHLGFSHTGEYEFLYLYHEKKHDLRRGNYGKRTPDVALAKLISNTYNFRVERSFTRDLVQYYDGC